MRARLLYAEADLAESWAPTREHEDVVHDLGFETVVAAMAGDDGTIAEVTRQVLAAGLATPAEVEYRHAVLRDCLRHPDATRELYGIAVGAVELKKHIYGVFSRFPDAILRGAVQTLEGYLPLLRRLADFAGEHAADYTSDGFTRLLAMLSDQLDGDYLATVEEHLRALRFRHGVLLSVGIGAAAAQTEHTLRRPHPDERPWYQRLTGAGRRELSFRIPDRDEAGANALAAIRRRGVNLAADALGRSADHVLGFLAALRRELAFYVGCLRLGDELRARGVETCLPRVLPSASTELAFSGLRDAALALTADGPVVGNDLDADDARLIMVTGANQGGKSTFLRSLGQAVAALRCGMPVAAGAFAAGLPTGVFTHAKREEDAEMVHGKLDEELERMRGVADRVRAGGVVLLNESFASTNEREGSEIARQIVRALTDSGVRTVYVTHLYDLATSLSRTGLDGAVFLRAEREADGERSFRILPGEPLTTSYGEDLYRRVFGEEAETRESAQGGA